MSDAMCSRFQVEFDRSAPRDLSLKRARPKISPHCGTSFTLPAHGLRPAEAGGGFSPGGESRGMVLGRSSSSRRARAVPTMPPAPSTSTDFLRISMESLLEMDGSEDLYILNRLPDALT